MKKILFLLLVLSVVGVYSCADLDDIQPTDSVPPEQAITNFNSASAALAGVYDEMQQDSYDKWLSLWQYFSDETVFTGTFPTRLEFGNFNVFTSNTTMAAVFSSYYDAINVANNVIALTPQVDDPSLTPEATNTIVAEARYLRGLCYLYLTQGWNDVPLVLEPTTTADEKLNVPTASRAEVLAQVRADFEFAAAKWASVAQQRAYDYLRLTSECLRPRRGGRVLAADPIRWASLLADSAGEETRGAKLVLREKRLQRLVTAGETLAAVQAVFPNAVAAA